MTQSTGAHLELRTDNDTRDAIGRLQFAELEVVPRSRTSAERAKSEELVDICTTRKLLEEQAARLAVRNLTSKDLELLERIAASLEVPATSKQPKKVAALHRQLHFTIYRAANRPHLLRLIEELWDLGARYSEPSSRAGADELSGEWYVVRSIVSACRLRDANALGLMIRYKVHRDSVRLLARVDSIESGSSKRLSTPRTDGRSNVVTNQRTRRR